MFQRGEEVFRCQPFAYVVSQSLRTTVCDFCLRSSTNEEWNYKKCSGCKYVYYCHVSCQKRAWLTNHREECAYLRKVSPKIPTDTVRLMARIIIKLKNGGLRDAGKLPDGQLRYFEDLMSHHKDIVRDMDRIEAFQAFYAVLQDCLGDKLPPKPEVLEVYGKILINSFNIMNNDYQPVGIGLYLEASILDHSCYPNATVVFDGKQLLLRTIKPVKSFADIRISYTNLLDSNQVRRENLQNQYYFTCECARCKDDEIDVEKASVACGSCQGCVPVSLRRCIECGQAVKNAVVEQHEKLTRELQDRLFKNVGGHPEPEDQCEDFYAEVSPIFHAYDKNYLDLLEILYEQRVAQENIEASLEICLQLLQHYRRNYPEYDVNIGLMELKAAKLCAFLNKLTQAHQHLLRAKDCLEVTHGETHPLLTVMWKQVKNDIEIGNVEARALASALKQKPKWAKSG